jgi:hypothetical protein
MVGLRSLRDLVPPYGFNADSLTIEKSLLAIGKVSIKARAEVSKTPPDRRFYLASERHRTARLRSRIATLRNAEKNTAGYHKSAPFGPSGKK